MYGAGRNVIMVIERDIDGAGAVTVYRGRKKAKRLDRRQASSRCQLGVTFTLNPSVEVIRWRA
jgi:hypothetical protein